MNLEELTKYGVRIGVYMDKIRDNFISTADSMSEKVSQISEKIDNIKVKNINNIDAINNAMGQVSNKFNEFSDKIKKKFK